MRNWDEARYPTSFASKVWGVPTPTGKLYVSKYLNLTPQDRKAHVAGATTLLTARRVMQGAIGSKLSHSFRTAAPACKAAMYFTDFSSPEEAPGFNRDPGQLFEDALTGLAAYPTGDGVVIRVDGAPLQQAFFPIGGAGIKLGRRQNLVVLLLLNPIFQRVEHELDKFDNAEANDADRPR